MSKKSMVIAGVVAIVAVALVATALFASRKTPSPSTKGTGAGSSATTSASAGVTGNGTAPGLTSGTTTLSEGVNAGSQGTKSGTKTGTNSGSTGSSNTNPDAGPLKPFPHLPDPGIAAQSVANPIAPGATLPPLIDAPTGTIYALKLGEVFSRGQYTIVMRPYGLGPDSIWGSGLVIRIDSATPVGKAPVNTKIPNANWLVIPNTTEGGTVTKGGTYKATLTFRSDGSKLLPILSQASQVK